ncbi:4481_t:CDS:2, partial [Racocetra persica]
AEGTMQELGLKTVGNENSIIEVLLKQANALAYRTVDKDYRKRLQKGSESCREMAQDLFLLETLKQYCNDLSKKVDIVFWYRDLALVAARDIKKKLGIIWILLDKIIEKVLEMCLYTTDDASLFLAREGKEISVLVVLLVIKQIVNYTSLQNWFSSYSLRIESTIVAISR